MVKRRQRIIKEQMKNSCFIINNIDGDMEFVRPVLTEAAQYYERKDWPYMLGKAETPVDA